MWDDITITYTQSNYNYTSTQSTTHSSNWFFSEADLKNFIELFKKEEKRRKRKQAREYVQPEASIF